MALPRARLSPGVFARPKMRRPGQPSRSSCCRRSRGWVLTGRGPVAPATIRAWPAFPWPRAKELRPPQSRHLFAQGSIALRQGQPEQGKSASCNGLKSRMERTPAPTSICKAHLLLSNAQRCPAAFRAAPSELRKKTSGGDQQPGPGALRAGLGVTGDRALCALPEDQCNGR